MNDLLRDFNQLLIEDKRVGGHKLLHEVFQAFQSLQSEIKRLKAEVREAYIAGQKSIGYRDEQMTRYDGKFDDWQKSRTDRKEVTKEEFLKDG